MKKTKLSILFSLLCIVVFSQEKNHFVDLEVEISKLNSNQIVNIVNRELEKFNSTNDSLYYMTSKYVELYSLSESTKYKNLPIYFELLKINNNKYESLTVGCLFGIAQQLEKLAPELSLESLNKAIEVEENLNQDKHHLPHLLHFKGRLLHNSKDYEGALNYYNKALEIFKDRKDTLFISSMYNNISMLYEKKNEFKKATDFSNLSIASLNIKKDLTLYERDFLIQVKTNKARCLGKLKKLNESEKVYDEIISYYKKTGNYNDLADCYIDLFKFFDTKNAKYSNLINEIIDLEPKDFGLIYKIKLCQILENHFFNQKNYVELKKYSDKLKKYNLKVTENIKEDYKKTFLYYNKITNELYDSNFKTKYLLQKKKSNIIIYSLITILSTLLFSIFLFISRRKKEKELLAIKTKFLEQEKLINEQEIELQKEKLKNLSFFLEVKNKVENSFLNEIKKLKKSKTDQNDVLDNLHISYHNLTEINKNFENINYNNNQEYKEIQAKIAERHPSLSTKELQYCVYFSNKLSSKEIAIIENITPASVRVFKNRIKNKLNLDANTNLEDYLSEI